MGVPWWLSGHDRPEVERVLRAADSRKRQRFEGSDADIVARLLRNGYVLGEIESTVIGHEGPILVEVVSGGLTDLGVALLQEIQAIGA